VQHGVSVGWRLLRVASAPRRPPEDLVPPGPCRFSREVCKVSRLSCCWSPEWLRGALVLAPRAFDDRGRCGGPSSRRRVGTGRSVGRKLSRLGVGVNNDDVFGCRSPSRRCCWDASCLVSVFQVKTFLRFFGGATMAGVTSFPSGASLWKTCDLLRWRFGLTGVGCSVAWLGF
jgi:hypothetical protein